jgi:hypothetical protein
MAWANRFHFHFDSAHGAEYDIYILKDGYNGPCDERALGRAPVLTKKQNGPICGTSLELYAECRVDNDGVSEYAEMYTSNPKEYMVTVYRDRYEYPDPLWFGFVSTELYSAPSIAPPYDVHIIATDGLGELKLNNYAAQGEMSLINLFKHLLGFTGYDRDFYFATNLKQHGATRTGLLDWRIDVDFLDGKSCYDVLTELLNTLHATITLNGNYWLIARETDISALLNSSGQISVIRYSNRGTHPVSIVTTGAYVKTIGQMGVADMWPIGYFSHIAVPAKRTVTVSSRWHIQQLLENPEMYQLLGGWTLEHAHYYNTGGRPGEISQYPGGISLGNDSSGTYGSAYQSFSCQRLNIPLRISVSTRGFENTYPAKLCLFVRYYADDGTVYQGDVYGWGQDLTVRHVFDVPSYSGEQSYEVLIPTYNINKPGDLYVFFHGLNVVVRKAEFTQKVQENGYKDIIHIDNNSRTESDEVEIMHGRITSPEFDYPPILIGAFKVIVSGERQLLFSFDNSQYSDMDFLSIMAIDRAMSVAAVRLKIEGLFDFPASMTAIPWLVRQGSQDFWVDTWELNLREDELKIEAVSLPDVSLTVDSESVVPIKDT